MSIRNNHVSHTTATYQLTPEQELAVFKLYRNKDSSAVTVAEIKEIVQDDAIAKNIFSSFYQTDLHKDRLKAAMNERNVIRTIRRFSEDGPVDFNTMRIQNLVSKRAYDHKKKLEIMYSQFKDIDWGSLDINECANLMGVTEDVMQKYFNFFNYKRIWSYDPKAGITLEQEELFNFFKSMQGAYNSRNSLLNKKEATKAAHLHFNQPVSTCVIIYDIANDVAMLNTCTVSQNVKTLLNLFKQNLNKHFPLHVNMQIADMPTTSDQISILKIALTMQKYVFSWKQVAPVCTALSSKAVNTMT